MSRGQDRDDWFEGVEAAEREATDRDGREDATEDWLHEVAPTPVRWLESLNPGVAVLAVVAVGFLIAVLAAAGVFSSSPRRSAPTVTSSSTTTSITPPTTTTQTQAQPLSTPTANLKPGDTGAQVKMLQRTLTRLGFSTGTIDGNYGPATVSAVTRFQRSVGLTADGIAGRATRAALVTALHPG